MEKEAKKFYYNVTRPIIELFLQYSSEYQTKRKKTINHGLVVKSIISDNKYQIFASFGAPLILQSDNGLEFRNQVVSSLKLLWPGIQIVHGRSRKPSTQGSVERSNGDFQNILGSDKSCTLTIDKVPKDKKVSVREAVKAVSIAGGQGVKACGCTSGNCNIGKCVCFNNKVPCNSRCHKGNPNPNCLRKHEPELPESQATTSKAVNKKSIFKNDGKSIKK
jgi:hypothetical protein